MFAGRNSSSSSHQMAVVFHPMIISYCSSMWDGDYSVLHPMSMWLRLVIRILQDAITFSLGQLTLLQLDEPLSRDPFYLSVLFLGKIKISQDKGPIKIGKHA
jgi:hypothetical protein